VRAGEETLRHSIAAATDPRTRARLRVDLAELLRARDAAAARAELDQALREGGPSGALTSAALSFARSLPPADRLAWLGRLAQRDGKTDGKTESKPTSPVLLSALAEAQLGADLPRDAALTWLGLARDERVALHHRRAAARKVAQLGDRLAPSEARAAEAVSAELSVGKGRRGPRSSPRENQDAAVALETKMSATSSSSTSSSTSTSTSRPHGPSPRAKRARPAATSIWDRALADARAGQASRSRRLGEEALRAAAPGPELNARVAALDTALREGGFIKDALRLRRTHLEALEGVKARPALVALAKEAEAAGLRELAAEWRADAGVVPVVSVAVSSPEPTSPEAHYLAAQRRLARDGARDSKKAGVPAVLAHVPAVLAHLEKALAGHPGADAALALAETLAARVASSEADLGNRKLDLLRAAHAAELSPSRRGRLGRRLAETLEARGDALGAVAVLESALADATSGAWTEAGSARRTSSPGSSRLDDLERVRAERVRLLRSLGRSRELSAALEKDAGALQGEARLAVLAEHATLLEAAGEAEKALDVRLMALAEFPGAPSVLDDARRRLDATGRAAESLALATAALEHTTDNNDTNHIARRRQLLRDVAILTEKAAGVDRSGAAEAWLAVLEVDPTDAQAAAAAERFLVATGDWERCADLLAWLAARAPTLPLGSPEGGAPSRAALLWRLAELRRARLGQIDEALRLYVELGAASKPALPPLADPPALAAFVRREPLLAVETARAAVAPTPADRSRALLDRARAFAERGRRDDAERDALAAIDFDPHNMEALSALEKFFEEPQRARLLVDELGRRAAKLEPSAAAPLFYGRGRAAARAGDSGTAREAYRRAMSLDPTLAEPIAALGALASKEGDWSEVAKLLESEVSLTTSSARKGTLLLELAVVQGDRLGAPARAVALLDDAARHLRDEPRVLDLRGRFNLAAGNWQSAAEALDQLAARSAAIPDAAERYFAVGAAAEAAGEIDRALTLYSRSYSRDGAYRPTLERLSAICFERGQWDNAWKATEALLDRHGAAIEPGPRATLLVRSALADLHVGQRVAAVAKLGEIVTRGPSYAPEAGIRDVAESWAGMHLEPRLLATLEPRRHERILRRARESFAIAEGHADPAHQQALEILGALAMVDGRWEEAFSALEALAADTTFEPQRRAEFLIAAADVMSRHYSDGDVAKPLYDRARALWPGHPRFGRTAQAVS
jgi:tetratricopeptide (TPR) repeat protein